MKKRFVKVIIYTSIILILGLGYKFIWEKNEVGIPCPLHYTTGLQCPTCGTTRMCVSIINLEFEKAFHYNPLMCILSPFICGYIIYCLYCYVVQRENLILKKIPIFVKIVFCIILLIYFIYRNL